MSYTYLIRGRGLLQLGGGGGGVVDIGRPVLKSVGLDIDVRIDVRPDVGSVVDGSGGGGVAPRPERKYITRTRSGSIV